MQGTRSGTPRERWATRGGLDSPSEMTLHDRSDTALPDTAPDTSAHRAIRMDEPALRGRGSGAVVITVKRRKSWAGQAAESPAGRDGHGALTLPSKAPRVFRIDAEGADGPGPRPCRS